MYKLCKTEHSATRQREMEYALVELMAIKPYEDITVSDLCDHLQIPRKSFYRYFSSKDGALYALLDHTMMGYESYNSVYHDGEQRTVEKDLTQFFQFWMEHKNLLDALSKNNMTASLVERVIGQIGSDDIIPTRFLSNLNRHGQKQVSLFCISGLMTIMLTWHKDGFPNTPEQMAVITARLVSEPLFPNLQQLIY